MIRLLAIAVVIALAPLFIVSCGGDDGSVSVQGVRKAVKKPGATTNGVQSDADKASEAGADVEELTTSRKTALRNPFKTYIITRAPATDKRVRGPLECCPIEVFKLTAVLSGTDDPRAMVLAPDGKKYVIKKGDRIGRLGGVVVDIERSKVVISERIISADGEPGSANIVELRLHIVEKSRIK